MKRSISVIMFFLLTCFSTQTLSANSEPQTNLPKISNPTFAIRNNIVRVTFDYADVAGSIRDARINLVVATPINRSAYRLQHFQFVLGGWKGFFWSAEDDRKLTRGSITAELTLPWYCGISQETNINGFGLVVADSRKIISNYYFVEGEIDRTTWLTKIFKLIMSVLN